MDTAGRTPGIVRAGMETGELTRWSLAWPVLAAALVVAAHAATVRLDAWPPLGGAGSAWLASVAHVPAWGLPGLAWPTRLVVVALGATAIAIALMARSSRRCGVPASAGAMLALVAAGGHLLWVQATTPTGTALLTALSAGLILRLPPTVPRRALVPALVIGLAGVGFGSVVTSWGWGPAGAAGAALRQDLGSPGLILAGLGLFHPLAAGLVAAGVLLLGVTAPLGTAAQAAVALPWAWALSACGLATLLEWRGRPLTRARMAWLAVALLAWASVQAAGRPWVARAELTQMSAIWARALADAATTSPIVEDASADADGLVAAWLRERAPGTPRVTLREAHDLGADAISTLLVPEVVGRTQWVGLPASDVPAALTTVSDLIDALPPDVVVVAGIGAEAASALTAPDWQALGTLGARVSSVGGPRVRAIMSVTGGRQQGDEVASADRAVLERLPGDPIGTSGHVSPLDMRLDVATRDIVLIERGRVRATARDTLVAVYRRNGTLLALWIGAGGRHLGAGRPGAAGPVVRRVAGVLPCRLVAADTDEVLEELGVNGALGVEAPAGARLTITTAWTDGGPTGHPRRVGEHTASAQQPAGIFTQVVPDAEPFGVDLRGRPARIVARADQPARVCAAQPLAPVVTLPGSADVPVHPRSEAAFGRGWHDMEPLGGGSYFRWSSGSGATLLWTLEGAPLPDTTVEIAFDMQNAGTPSPDDRLQLTVNGTALAPQPVSAGRGLYSWAVPGLAFRTGLNEVRLDTTLTVRPSEFQAGSDDRRLGFALHGWQVR